MDFLFSIVPTLIVLGLLILIHEVGHFLACRFLGVHVEKFSIGFGPEILHWQTKTTRYAISLLPLGGFVKPAGETISEIEGAQPKKGDYLAAPLFVRILIVIAGVAMNYLLALVLFIAIFMIGRPVPGTTVGGFVEGYPAEASGLLVGDRIVEIGGREVNTWVQLTDILEKSTDTQLNLMVERFPDGEEQGRLVALTVAPKIENIQNVFGENFQIRRLGIMPNPESHEFERFGFLASLKRAGQTEWALTVMTHKAIYFLLIGKLSPKSLAGPIGIISLTGSATKLGLPYVLQLMATLSISLAVINLLPIPALDGGHLLFLLIEGVRRRQVSLAVQERASQVGFILLMALMVFVIYNDLANLDVYEKIQNLFRSRS